MLNYSILKEKTDRYYEDNFKSVNETIPDEIEKARLFNFMANILNQIVYDSYYTIKREDFDFLIKYNIDVTELLNEFANNEIIEKREL
ncbi:MAG: hypothetical protein RSB67_03025 [Clostridia bacterium]